MNSLSWLLYWADVLPSLSTWLAFVAFAVVCASLIGSVIFVSLREATKTEKKGVDPKTHEWTYVTLPHNDQAFARSLWWSPIVSVIALLLWGSAFLVPSKDTFYMIAGSEIGERAISTPEFNKVRRVVNDFLDEKLNKEDNKEKNDG